MCYVLPVLWMTVIFAHNEWYRGMAIPLQRVASCLDVRRITPLLRCIGCIRDDGAETRPVGRARSAVGAVCNALLPRCLVKTGNECVPKIILNNTTNLFLTAITISVISNHNSFRVLFDEIACVYFIWKIYLYFSIGNGQRREPALCQSYRHTFVRYWTDCSAGDVGWQDEPMSRWRQDEDTVAETECGGCHSDRFHDDAASCCSLPRSHRHDVIVCVINRPRWRHRKRPAVSMQLLFSEHRRASYNATIRPSFCLSITLWLTTKEPAYQLHLFGAENGSTPSQNQTLNSCP